MKIFCKFLILILCMFLHSGHSVNPFYYDYAAATKCLPEPPRADNGGGVVLNHDFEDGIKGWRVYGNATIREGVSKQGNKYIVVHNRTSPLDSASQRVQIQLGNIYSFSAWVTASQGSDQRIRVSLRCSLGQVVPVGEVVSKHGCWSQLRGGLIANFSGPVDILFQSENATPDLWIDNVSLQPITKVQWRVQQDQIIEKIRKSKVRFQVTYPNKTAAKGALISINQKESSFPFGCAMNFRILESKGYQDWFASRFKVTSFTNEMKWYSTETSRGQENYTVADTMLKFAQDNGILVRGHNILWDNPRMQPCWVRKINAAEDLMNVTLNRIHSVVSRYAGQLIGWDVVNENVHFRFFEDMLGENASAIFYHLASKLDPNITMFMNEFNTIEYSRDTVATALNFKKKLEEILAYPGNEMMKAGIGLQGHFGTGQPNIVYMRSALDTLGAMGFPIWLTELDMPKSPDQEKYLEDILREAYSHPAVEGIIMFAGPEVSGFDRLTMTDKDFNNTPVGDLVDRLIDEWTNKELDIAVCNSKEGEDGFSPEVSLFHGHYNVTVKHPLMANLSASLVLDVKKETPEQVVHVVLGP